MIRTVHGVAGVLAIAIIACFWIATVFSELFLPGAGVSVVKMAIPWGFLLLIPVIGAAAGTGLKLAQGQRPGRIGSKLRRIPIIAANGVLILVPAALYLAFKANAGQFDTAFFTAQFIELAAGLANIVLLGRNMRDGLKMTHRTLRKPA